MSLQSETLPVCKVPAYSEETAEKPVTAARTGANPVGKTGTLLMGGRFRLRGRSKMTSSSSSEPTSAMSARLSRGGALG
eukprot:3296155-Rhodomonas_salina.1